MSYENLLAGLYTNNLTPENPFETDPRQKKPQVEEEEPPPNKVQLFSVDDFKDKLRDRNGKKNKNYQDHSVNITSYDIFSCIRIPFFRIGSYPVEDYSNSWLPIEIRATMGTAVHEFIQGVPGVFTETEVRLKVPSLRISLQLDGLINDNVIVEIKSCGYTDYEKILKSNKPRSKDFYQTMIYKYIIENHLEETRNQPSSRAGSSLALLDKYNIDYIQFIYVCHELISAEAETISESIDMSKVLKRQLESRRNPFWFMKTLTIDLTKFDATPYVDYIKAKINAINTYLESNQPPPLDHKYINKKDCYFCLYNKICSNY